MFELFENLHMRERMLFKIYAQPLWRVAAEILLAALIWAVLSATFGKRRPKLWRMLNLCLLAVSAFLIVYLTILKRNAGEHELILRPWYFLQEGKIQPEIYRSLLMNVLMFTPFGLSLGAGFSSGMKPWRCVLITLLIAIAFSVAVETTQYFAGLGRAETDDVGANALGAFIGALHVPIGAALRKGFEKSKE